MENKNTSFELSEKLWNNGCRLGTDYFYFCENGQMQNNIKIIYDPLNKKQDNYCYIPCFDIIWDICIKYYKEFFSTKNIQFFIPNVIFNMIKDNKSREKIEKFLWEHCKFNPENKEE